MKQFPAICLALVLLVPVYSYSAEINQVEIYPKPAKTGEDVFVYLRIAGVDGISILSDDFTFLVAGEVVKMDLTSMQADPSGELELLFKATAHREFDWRNFKVRYREMDYPSGPDDPYLICDAPFRVKSAATSIPISATIHEANEDDVQIQYIDVINYVTGALVSSYPIWEWLSDPFHNYLLTDLNAGHFNCAVGDTAWIKIIIYCDDHDIPWIPENYTYTQILKVRVGRELPAPTGWYYGDIHTHSLYTNNIYEYGGALEMYPACAEAIGLSFTAVSDHSSDYDANGDLWQQMADDCVTYSTEAVHLIPAEEVSLDDNEVDETIDNRIHMLNYSGIFIPGPEAPISGSMHTSSRFTFLSEAIPQMEGVGGFYYAAHPFQDYDPFAYLFGMAMMPWSEENYTLSRSTYTFSGLQLWNERNFYKKNVSYSYYLDPFPWQLNPTWGTESAWVNEGIAQWDEFLSIGLAENLINTALLPYKSFISAGSDCHGDFNYRTYNVDPIFFDVYATDNAFGNLRTCVYVPGYEAGQLPPVEELLTSYRLGRSFITDGPSLIMGIDTNGDGDLNDAEDLNIGDQNNIFSTEVSQAQCIIRWESTEDWGALESMVLYHGTSATGSAPTAAWTYGSGGYLVEQIIPLSTLVSSPTNGWEYLRAEAIGAPQSDGARQAYTNPVWIRIDTTPTSSVTLESAEDLIFISENGGSFEYTITIENHQSTSINCGVWMDVALPNGNVFPLLNVPVTLPASQAISRPREQTVPPDAPPGVYAYQAHIGDYPTAWSSSQISFIKIGETNNRGLLVDWPASEPIFNTEKLQNSSPSGFKLGAYPNPFNPTTTLSYELRVAGSVLLNVYDIQGCEVAKLVDDYRDAGVHEVTFDASGLASGVYLYRLIHASSQKGQKHATLTGKMVLLK